MTIDDFLNSQPHSHDEVFSNPSPVPEEPGVYGWWFRRIPRAIDVSGCRHRDRLTLLYGGISPNRPPTNGRPPSRQTLRTRIRYHYHGNAEGSTLRKTLGVLLADELGIELRMTGSGKRLTFCPDGEKKLSAWMAENALVAWFPRSEPWLLEDQIIATVDLPLNIQGNANNPFYAELRRLRADAALKAQQLPPCP